MTSPLSPSEPSQYHWGSERWQPATCYIWKTNDTRTNYWSTNDWNWLSTNQITVVLTVSLQLNNYKNISIIHFYWFDQDLQRKTKTCYSLTKLFLISNAADVTDLEAAALSCNVRIAKTQRMFKWIKAKIAKCILDKPKDKLLRLDKNMFAGTHKQTKASHRRPYLYHKDNNT